MINTIEYTIDDFIQDVQRMQRLYKSGKHTKANELMVDLADRLDDIMRL